VVPTDAITGPQRQYCWPPNAISGGPQASKYSLLRQIAQGTESDPAKRLDQLERRKQDIAQLREDPQAGLLDRTAVRERYQQFAATARDLLADFRQVEENFRALDRSARERIATWQGSKGELLAELVHGRSMIDSSDQGRSFQAFYDLLLSTSGQEELSMLLERLTGIVELGADRRLADRACRYRGVRRVGTAVPATRNRPPVELWVRLLLAPASHRSLPIARAIFHS